MGKAPAFQFYPGDWQRDMDVHPLEIEGAWIRICCRLWWAPQRGRLTLSTDRWATILRIDEHGANRIIDYLLSEQVASGQREHNGYITLISRRMVQDEKEREFNRLRQQRFYNKNKHDANLTPLSREPNAKPNAVSSSSSSTSLKRLAQNAFAQFWSIYPKKKSKGQAEKAFSKINPDEQLLAVLIAKIEQAKKSDDWLKDGGTYIPYPATWLNGKRWEDEDCAIEKKQPTMRCEKCDGLFYHLSRVRAMNLCSKCVEDLG